MSGQSTQALVASLGNQHKRWLHHWAINASVGYIIGQSTQALVASFKAGPLYIFRFSLYHICFQTYKTF